IDPGGEGTRDIECQSIAGSFVHSDVEGWRDNSLPTLYILLQRSGYRRSGRRPSSARLSLSLQAGISPVHQAQILSYLKLSGKSFGLLINFNVVHLKEGAGWPQQRCPNPKSLAEVFCLKSARLTKSSLQKILRNSINSSVKRRRNSLPTRLSLTSRRWSTRTSPSLASC